MSTGAKERKRGNSTAEAWVTSGRMNDLTIRDISRIREELERDAASALGRALFAFSGLDTNLGLMVASTLRHLGKDGQAMNAGSLNFKTRLEFVENYVVTTPEVAPMAILEMKTWISQAHAARLQRNQLVHGRWSVDPHKRKALLIVGLPGSDVQQTIEYTIAELEAISEEFQRLNSALSQARRRWHLP